MNYFIELEELFNVNSKQGTPRLSSRGKNLAARSPKLHETGFQQINERLEEVPNEEKLALKQKTEMGSELMDPSANFNQSNRRLISQCLRSHIAATIIFLPSIWSLFLKCVAADAPLQKKWGRATFN